MVKLYKDFSTAASSFINTSWLQLPQDQGIGGREYMAAIRIVPVNAATDSRQLQFQSARTRCVNPSKEHGNPVRVFWDEVFVFEVKSGVCLLPVLISFLFGRVVMIYNKWSIADIVRNFCFISKLISSSKRKEDMLLVEFIQIIYFDEYTSFPIINTYLRV